MEAFELPHGAVLFLSSGIENVQQASFLINGHLFSVRILNGRVVLVDKMVLNELNGER